MLRWHSCICLRFHLLGMLTDWSVTYLSNRLFRCQARCTPRSRDPLDYTKKPPRFSRPVIPITVRPKNPSPRPRKQCPRRIKNQTVHQQIAQPHIVSRQTSSIILGSETPCVTPHKAWTRRAECKRIKF